MFNHFVAVDWAMSNMAIARMTKKSNQVSVVDIPADIKNLQIYLKNLKGSICLTFEETTTSQWLFTELNDYVDRIIVCDPYRNKLLNEGAKTDSLDATRLVQLLKAGLVKEVYHTNHKYVEYRKLVNGYEDLINMGIRAKNQRSALFRAVQKDHKRENGLDGKSESFVLEGLDRLIENYEEERKRYQREFAHIKKSSRDVRLVSKVPGMGDIHALKVVSRVIDANRFKKRNHFLSYCGLIKHEKISGGRSYGRKSSRFCPMMKNVFKAATMASLKGENEFSNYYHHLILEKNYPISTARHATCRKLATVVYGIMKSKKQYKPSRRIIEESDL